MTHAHVHGPGAFFTSLGLLQAMAERWWLVLLRGIAAILFGILAFGWPGLTLVALTLVWGAYAIVDGALALGGAISGKAAPFAPRWWLAVVGICGIVAGGVAFYSPVTTAQVLLWFIGAWAVVVGALQVWGGWRLRKEIEGEWMLIASGLLWIALGVILYAQPAAGALAVAWLIGTLAVLAGFNYVMLAFRLRKLKSPA